MHRRQRNLRTIVEIAGLTLVSWALVANVQSNWSRGHVAALHNLPLFFSRFSIMVCATLLMLVAFKRRRAAQLLYLGIVLPLALWVPTLAMLIIPTYDSSQPFQCYYLNRSKEDVYVLGVGLVPAVSGSRGEKRNGYSKSFDVTWWKGTRQAPADSREVHRVTVACPNGFKYGDALLLVLNEDAAWSVESLPRGK